MPKRRVRVVVRGLVQGVGFRYYTQQEGTALGLVGFVRNAGDGSVEVEAEGERVDDLILWLRNGPRHANVDSIEIEEITLQASEQRFEIVR